MNPKVKPNRPPPRFEVEKKIQIKLFDCVSSILHYKEKENQLCCFCATFFFLF